MHALAVLIAPPLAQVQHPEIKAKLTQAQARERERDHPSRERDRAAQRGSRARASVRSRHRARRARPWLQALLRRNQDLVDDIQRRQSAAQADQSSVSAQNGLHKCPVLIQELNSNLAQARVARLAARSSCVARSFSCDLLLQLRGLQVVKLYSVFQQDSAANAGSTGGARAAS